MLATLEYRGATLSAEELPSITINISTHKTIKKELGIKISDGGGGFSLAASKRMFEYFHTSQVSSTPTYTYSGGFGTPFAGLGCGLPLTRSYARYMGGDVNVMPLIGDGTDAFIVLNKLGTASDIDNLE